MRPAWSQGRWSARNGLSSAIQSRRCCTVGGPPGCPTRARLRRSVSRSSAWTQMTASVRCALSRRAAPAPLDDQQRAAGWYLDRARAPTFVPPGRAVGHRPPRTRGGEDAADQQVGPAEPGVPPGNVVGMHHGRSLNDVLQPCRQRRLAAGTAPVHGQDQRATDASAAPRQHRSGRDGRQLLRTPWRGFGLPMGETQRHGDKCYPGMPGQCGGRPT